MAYDWGPLLGAGLGALGNYQAGNQFNNAAQNAAQMSDPFAPYRTQYAQQLNSVMAAPMGYTNGPWNQQSTAFNQQPYSQTQAGFTSGPWNQQLSSLQANPSSVANLPGYQFGLGQGVQAIDRSAAAKGLLDSGATGKALTRFGQDYAGQQFNTERNFLSGQATQEANRAQQGFQNQQAFLGGQGNFEAQLAANQQNQLRNFLGQASGANFNPSTAAALAMAGRTGQLGAYNQGLGSLLGSGLFGQPQQQGGLSGLQNLFTGGKQGEMSPVGSAINYLGNLFGGGSTNVLGTPGFSNWGALADQSGNAGSFAGIGAGTGAESSPFNFLDYSGAGGGGAGMAGADLGGLSSGATSYPFMDYGSPLVDYGGLGSAGSDLLGGAGSFGVGSGAATGSTAIAPAAAAADTGAGIGAAEGAGLGGFAAAAPFLAGAGMLYSWGQEPSPTNQQQIASAMSGTGGPQAYVNGINSEIAGLSPTNYQSLIDKYGPAAIEANRTSGNPTSDPGQLANMIMNQISNNGGLTDQYNRVFNPAYDPKILQSYIGAGTYNDLQSRMNTALQQFRTGITPLVQQYVTQALSNPNTLSNPYLYGNFNPWEA